MGSEEKRTDSDHHKLDTVEVLDLAARARGVAWSVYRDVHVAPKGSLGIE